MSEKKASGGPAPFGYRWHDGRIVVDNTEAPVRRLIYDLYIKHRRKKVVAKLLNDLGYRTRSASLFSDTTIDRLLRDSTARGIRIVDGEEVEVAAIVSVEIWEYANKILGRRRLKQSTHLFSGIAFCSCGGKMFVPSSLAKYVCEDCRHKILTADLEDIFLSQLANYPESEYEEIRQHWELFNDQERRIIVEQICDRIVIARDAITIRLELGYEPNSFKAAADEQHPNPGNGTGESIQSSGGLPFSSTDRRLNTAAAAVAIGISEATLNRRRRGGHIGYFQDGWRITYSEELHIKPYLEKRNQHVP